MSVHHQRDRDVSARCWGAGSTGAKRKEADEVCNSQISSIKLFQKLNPSCFNILKEGDRGCLLVVNKGEVEKHRVALDDTSLTWGLHRMSRT